jgi:hypothetical protein
MFGSVSEECGYVSTLTGTALGFFVTLYATLITLFGLAWVLFLIGTSESHFDTALTPQVGLMSAERRTTWST